MKTRGKNLTKIEKLEIVEKYNTGLYTCAALGKLYNKSGEAISHMLKSVGVQVINDPANLQRKYTLNQYYFNQIDTEEKAYFLGFLLGDGYHNEKAFSTVIEVHNKDIDILLKFKIALECDKPLVIRKNRDSSILSINSKILSSDLKQLGFIQNKSFELSLPVDKIPTNLLRHFCRGLYDADGSFSLNLKKNSYVFQSCLVVSEIACNQIGTIISDALDIKYYICKPNKKHTTQIRNFNVWGIDRTLKLIDWLYQDSNIYLNRKYNKYLIIKSIIDKLD